MSETGLIVDTVKASAANAPRSFIGKCPKCKVHSQLCAEVVERRPADYNRVTGRCTSPARRSWRVTTGQHAGTVTPLESPWNGRWQIGVECPKCKGAQMSFNAVEGTVTDKPCGGRCMASKGPTCECACGGENHGKNHA